MLLSDFLSEKEKIEDVSKRFPDIKIGQPNGITKTVLYSSDIKCNAFEYIHIHNVNRVDVEFFHLDEITNLKIFPHPYVCITLGRGSISDIRLFTTSQTLIRQLKDFNISNDLIDKFITDLEKRSPATPKLEKFLTSEYYEYSITDTKIIQIHGKELTLHHLIEIKNILDVHDISLQFEDDMILLIPV